MRLTVVSVGRLRPPFVDDVQHYKKLLARHVRLELVEVREDEAVSRRLPPRAFVSLLARDGEELTSEDLAAWPSASSLSSIFSRGQLRGTSGNQ